MQKTLQQWIADLDDPYSVVRQTAVAELSNCPAAVPDLIATLQLGSLLARREAAYALKLLGLNGDGLLPAAIDALRDPDEELRFTAASLLGKLGPLEPATVPRLIELLSDQNSYVRADAAIALGKVGVPAASATPQLKKALAQDPEPDVRWRSAEALGRIGPSNAVNPVPFLVQACRDESPDVRYHACLALGAFREQAFPFLQEAVRQRDLAVQTAACYSLSAFGEPALSSLIWALQDAPDPEVRDAAATALGELRPATAIAVSVLIAALADCSSVDARYQVRHSAIESLSRIGAPLIQPAIPALVELLEDEDFDIRRKAQNVLRSLGYDA